MCATRFFRISAANIGPNRFHQKPDRLVADVDPTLGLKRSSTLRSDSGYLTYIITTRRITFGELLKYWLPRGRSYHSQTQPEKLV